MLYLEERELSLLGILSVSEVIIASANVVKIKVIISRTSKIISSVLSPVAEMSREILQYF